MKYFLVAAGIFGFAQRDLNVPENGGTVQIAVEAIANLSTPVTLRYVNSNHSCQLFILDLPYKENIVAKTKFYSPEREIPKKLIFISQILI